MPKHDLLNRDLRPNGKRVKPSALFPRSRQVRQLTTNGDGRTGKTLQFLVQIGGEFLVSAKDGLVAFGPKDQARTFRSRRGAWAVMGIENVPTPLLNSARLIVVTDPEPPLGDLVRRGASS